LSAPAGPVTLIYSLAGSGVSNVPPWVTAAAALVAQTQPVIISQLTLGFLRNLAERRVWKEGGEDRPRILDRLTAAVDFVRLRLGLSTLRVHPEEEDERRPRQQTFWELLWEVVFGDNEDLAGMSFEAEMARLQGGEAAEGQPKAQAVVAVEGAGQDDQPGGQAQKEAPVAPKAKAPPPKSQQQAVSALMGAALLAEETVV
jgi:hypothetical protein